MYKDIQKGDMVYFSTPHTAQMKGKAVMLGPIGWVVNRGGKHGMPFVVTERNYIKHNKGRNRKPDHLGEFLSKYPNALEQIDILKKDYLGVDTAS